MKRLTRIFSAVFPFWTRTILYAIGAFAVGYGARGEVISAPPIVASGVQHAFSVGDIGKTEPHIVTSISDSLQFSTPATWTPIWHDPVTWVTTVSAPEGYQFVVSPPSAPFNSFMQMWITWGDYTHENAYRTIVRTSCTFDGIVGTAPGDGGTGDVVQDQQYQNVYGLNVFAGFNVVNPFSFRSITFTTTAPLGLEGLPVETFSGWAQLVFRANGEGSLPDCNLISLQPIPEPSSTLMLAVAGLTVLTYRYTRR
jgi:hypothetical protein